MDNLNQNDLDTLDRIIRKLKDEKKALEKMLNVEKIEYPEGVSEIKQSIIEVDEELNLINDIYGDALETYCDDNPTFDEMFNS